ncbi:MAG: FtsX-like permease family protein, partial [Candidatus Hodarchaeota archaeon]
EKTKFNTLLTELDNSFSTLDSYFELIDVYQLQTGLGKSETRMQILKILLLLIDLPVIAVSLYLVSYSFNLIKRRKIETIGTIKTRGASREQIFIFLTSEVIISTIVALFCGLLLGFFLTEMLLKSINFLDFSGQKIPVVIQTRIILNLIVISFVVILVLNLSSIARYSKMTIFESTKPVEKKEPFWKQYYLDFMSTAIGLVGYYIINEIGKSTLNWEESPLVPLIFLLLGVPAPFLLFAGSILVIARIFPLIIDKLAKILWKKTGLIFAFALMNIFRHKQTATRTVILITLALSYVIISASLAFSIDESKRFETNYNTGADIKLNAPYLNASTLNRLYNNISEINTISQVVFGFIPSAHGIHYYIFCFVDTESFAETAFFDEKIFGLSEPLDTLMAKLSDNKSILLYRPNFEGRPKLKINDTFTFSLPNRTEETRLNYTIVGSFNLWPQSTQYYRQSTDLSRYTYFVIGSLGMYDDLIEPELISLSSIHYIIDLEEGSDIELISEKIWLITGFLAQSAELLYLNYEKSVDRRFGLSLLNSTLISCIVISLVGAFTFTIFTYLERDKERGIERALGMTRLQTGILFSIEGLVILLFGIIIGLCTGLINTTFFLFVAQLGRSVPPIIVAYPFDFISTFILIIAIIACSITLIIAYQSTRRDISRVLKVE